MHISTLSWRWTLGIATFAMLFQTAFSYVAQIVMPILADRVAEEFGISRGWLGLYLFLQNFVAIVAAIGCGGFILRYGPLRVSQISLALMAVSLLVISTGILWLYPMAALLMGTSAASTPASSHILARVCPPHIAPVIFSVKQTGVPVGALIGGLLLPFLLGLVFYSATLGTTVRLGTYGTAAVTAFIVFTVVIALQPIREHFDSARNPQQKISLGDLRTTMRMVLDNYPLRDIAFAAFAFGGLQSVFAGFFILFMIDGLGHSEVSAGQVFAIASFCAIWARILWGILGGSILTPRRVFSIIGLISAVSAVAILWIDTTWSISAILVVAIFYNISALSWHGILLAEVARLVPANEVGGTTGGVLAFTSIAMMIYPAIFGLLLALTDSYKIGFALASIPAFIAFVMFIYGPVPGPWTGALASTLERACCWRNAVRVAAVMSAGIVVGIVMFRFTG
ncbi:MAG: MFS family permease [Gammaproteobacteria bacterium]